MVRSSLKKIKFLTKIVRTLRIAKARYSGVNWFKTIYINFKTQKFSDAKKIPILLYGKIKISSLSGQIIFNNEIKHRMLIIGKPMDGFTPYQKSLLSVGGKLICDGYNLFSTGCTISVNGVCHLKKGAGGSTSTIIRCDNEITIGRFSRFGFQTLICDTNFHYMRNIETGKISRCSGKIEIGDFCWIGMKVVIMKGTVLPERSIVAGSSLLNKNYSIDAPFAPTIAGSPAKIIAHSFVRILDATKEEYLNEFFKTHNDINFIEDEIGYIDETEVAELNIRRF